MEHIAIPAGERHPAHNWQFADAAERLAAAVTSEEVGCLALQLDTHDLWRLVSVGPAVWKPINGSRYTHTQSSAADEWIVNHNFGRWPASVRALTAGGAEMWAEVVHASVNQVRIYFDSPTAGTAICS